MPAEHGTVTMADEPAEGARRYDLFTRDGETRFVWSLTDEGVALEADALVLMRAGQWTRAPFDEIVSVTLASGVIGRGNTMGSCTITLGSNGKVIVGNTNKSGVADGFRDGIYRRFVVDFHKQLLDSGAATGIDFHSGFSQTRMTGLILTLIVATGFFLVLPFILLIATHDLKALLILLVGAALVMPVYRVARTNQPSTYGPADPPDLLP